MSADFCKPRPHVPVSVPVPAPRPGGGSRPSRLGLCGLLSGLLCALQLLCLAGGSAGESLPKDGFRAIEQAYGLEIVYDRLDTAIPASWKLPPTNFRAEPLQAEDLAWLKQALPRALAAYPKSLLKRNLRALWLARRFNLYDQLFGATYSYAPGYDPAGRGASAIFLSAGLVEAPAGRAAFVIDSFHHEFSSLLWLRYPFPEKAWRAANPKGFRYTFEGHKHPGFEALKKGVDTEGSEAMYRQGFLSGYAMSALEEDLNVLAGQAFTSPAALSRMALRHPALKRKLELLLGFYASIDAGFADSLAFGHYARKGIHPDPLPKTPKGAVVP